MRPALRWGIGLAVLGVIAAGSLLLLRRAPEAEVITVRGQTTELVLAVVGRVRPDDLVEVRSTNAGQVTRILVDDGAAVAAGQVLAVVRSEVEAAQTRAEAARVRAAEAETEEARLAFERTRALAERGFAAPAALDQARARLATARASQKAAQAGLEAQAAQTREFEVRAPMSGVVLMRYVDAGQVVTPTTTLMDLGSRGRIEIRAEVDEAYADALRPGMAARAALSGSDAVFPVRLGEVAPRVDATSGGRLIKLYPEAPSLLVPGRSVDVNIVVEQRNGALVIPRSAILEATAKPKVMVVGADDTIQPRAVQVLRWPSANAIITGGLRAGERIVVKPEGLKAGARIRPMAAAGGRS